MIKGKRCKRVLLLAAVLVAFSVLLTACNSTKPWAGESAGKYHLRADGTRVADIPRDSYLLPEEPPDVPAVQLDAQDAGEANAARIQAAIDQTAAEGGGVVLMPEGTYFISTVRLQSGITLWVPKGTFLRAMDYKRNRKSSAPIADALIFAENCESVRITGGGVIDGNGESYTKKPKKKDVFRPLDTFHLKTRVLEARKRIREPKKGDRHHVILINECSDVSVDNIELSESATWTLVLRNTNRVRVKNLVIDNNIYVANSDGIDVVGCREVEIEKCFIATGDDGICIKANSGKPVEQVSVRECEILSLANCFKIGTETNESVSGIDVRNCYFFKADIAGGYAGIAIESADGSAVADVSVSGIEMQGVSAPFLIWLGHRLMGGEQVGSVSDITLKDIEAVDVEMPSAIVGCIYNDKEYSVQRVTIENVEAAYRDTKENLKIKDPVPETAMGGYPDITRVSHRYFLSHAFSGYWDLPAYALYVRHAQDLQIENFSVTPRSANTRPAIVRAE